MPEENGAEKNDPEENDNESSIEVEMLKMMQEEGEDEGQPAAEADPEAGAEVGLEAQMLQTMMAETGAASQAEVETALQKTQSLLPEQELSLANIQRLIDIKLAVSIELGRTEVLISTILGWAEGSLIELDKASGDPVDVLINGKTLARGEVVVISENFGVRLTEMVPLVSTDR